MNNQRPRSTILKITMLLLVLNFIISIQIISASRSVNTPEQNEDVLRGKIVNNIRHEGRAKKGGLLKTLNTTKDIGFVHNEIGRLLHDKMFHDQMPQTRSQYFDLLQDVTSKHLCGIPNGRSTSCFSIHEDFDENEDLDSIANLLGFDDSKLRFDSILKTVSNLDSNNIHLTLNEIDQHLENMEKEYELRERSGTNKNGKLEGMASDLMKSSVYGVASVAKASSELWTEHMTNPNSAFYQFVHLSRNDFLALHEGTKQNPNNKRRLDDSFNVTETLEYLGIDTVIDIITTDTLVRKLVMQDVRGAIRGVFWYLGDYMNVVFMHNQGFFWQSFLFFFVGPIYTILGTALQESITTQSIKYSYVALCSVVINGMCDERPVNVTMYPGSD